MTAVEQAKQVLKDHGYYVDKLWTVWDIKETFVCTDGQAQEVLDRALNSERVVEEIRFDIDYYAGEQGLIKKGE